LFQEVKVNKIVDRIEELIEMVSKAYRFLIINLMIAKMRRRVDGIGTKIDHLLENIEIVDMYKNSIELRIDELNKEVDALLN